MPNLKVLSLHLQLDCKSSEFPEAKHITDCDFIFQSDAFSNNQVSGTLLVELLKKLPKLQRLTLSFCRQKYCEFRDSLFQMILFVSSQNEKMIVGPVYNRNRYIGTLIVKRKIRDFAVVDVHYEEHLSLIIKMIIYELSDQDCVDILLEELNVYLKKNLTDCHALIVEKESSLYPKVLDLDDLS